MEQDRSSACDRLGQRLGLMRELARSLEQSQTAVLWSDLREMECQTAQQQRLCAELGPLGPNFLQRESRGPTRLPAQAGNQVRLLGEPESLAVDERREGLLRELAEVELQVAELNRAYAALLRRASRTVEIFCRVLATSGVTYAPPQTALTLHTGLRE